MNVTLKLQKEESSGLWLLYCLDIEVALSKDEDYARKFYNDVNSVLPDIQACVDKAIKYSEEWEIDKDEQIALAIDDFFEEFIGLLEEKEAC